MKRYTVRQAWLVYIEEGEVDLVLVCTRAPTRLYE